MSEEFFLKDASEEKLKRIAHLKKLADSGVNLAEYLEEEKRKSGEQRHQPEDEKDRTFEDSQLAIEAISSGRKVERYIEIIKHYDALIMEMYGAAKEIEKAFWDARNKARKTKTEKSWMLAVRVKAKKRGDLATNSIEVCWATFYETGKKPILRNISGSGKLSGFDRKRVLKESSANQWEKMLFENFNPYLKEVAETISDLQNARAEAVRRLKTFLTSRIPL